jgi:hypothetical protein
MTMKVSVRVHLYTLHSPAGRHFCAGLVIFNLQSDCTIAASLGLLLELPILLQHATAQLVTHPAQPQTYSSHPYPILYCNNSSATSPGNILFATRKPAANNNMPNCCTWCNVDSVRPCTPYCCSCACLWLNSSSVLVGILAGGTWISSVAAAIFCSTAANCIAQQKTAESSDQ